MANLARALGPQAYDWRKDVTSRRGSLAALLRAKAPSGTPPSGQSSGEPIPEGGAEKPAAAAEGADEISPEDRAAIDAALAEDTARADVVSAEDRAAIAAALAADARAADAGRRTPQKAASTPSPKRQKVGRIEQFFKRT
jgi:hypothetical protein